MVDLEKEKENLNKAIQSNLDDEIILKQKKILKRKTEAINMQADLLLQFNTRVEISLPRGIAGLLLDIKSSTY